MFEKRREERTRIAALREIELFTECSDSELRLIDSIGSEVAFQPGKKLTNEGSGGLEFMVIVAGQARVTRAGKEIAALNPGAFFGEQSLLAGTPRNATVAATASTRCLVLHAGEFARLLEMPSVNARILRTAGERTVISPRFSRKRSRIAVGSARGIPA